MTAQPSLACRAAGRSSVGAICALVAILAAPARAELPAADAKTLAEMALHWAAEGGISDIKLLKDRSELIVASINLPKNVELRIPDRKVTVLSLQEIQARADKEGDFLYFRFGPFRTTKQGVSVPVSLVWAIGAHSKTQYLSGGGATLDFERRDGTWQLLPVTEHWIS